MFSIILNMTLSKRSFVQYDEIQSLQEVSKMLLITLQFVKFFIIYFTNFATFHIDKKLSIFLANNVIPDEVLVTFKAKHMTIGGT